MNKKKMIYFFIIIGIVVVSLLLYPLVFCGFSIIKVEAQGRNVLCYLQWHGYDQTTICIEELSDLGRNSGKYTKVVDNGEVFTISVIANYSWVEFLFNNRKVSLSSDGNNAILR